MVPRVLICLDDESVTRLKELTESTGRSASAIVRALIMATEPPRPPTLAPRADWENQVKGHRRASGKEQPCERS